MENRNHNYKGGSIASNGYKLIYVGKDHHLADVRGYAYEHRIEIEKKVGRRLLPGELVHHKDGVKINNCHDNIELKKSTAHHFVEHRKKGSKLKLPDEPNPIVLCDCGCGETFSKFDSYGRPRKYISGHNPPLATTQKKIIEILSDGGYKSLSQIVNYTGVGKAPTKTALTRMVKNKMIKRISHGIYSY